MAAAEPDRPPWEALSNSTLLLPASNNEPALSYIP